MKQTETKATMTQVKSSVSPVHYKTWSRRAFAGALALTVMGGFGISSAASYDVQASTTTPVASTTVTDEAMAENVQAQPVAENPTAAEQQAANLQPSTTDKEKHQQMAILDETTARSIVAKTITIPEDQLTFKDISLIQVKAPASQVALHPIYRALVTHEGVVYEVSLDAVTGQVIATNFAQAQPAAPMATMMPAESAAQSQPIVVESDTTVKENAEISARQDEEAAEDTTTTIQK
ncbi:hypothetical protein [uncultured Veillonella sp.]|uniref:hypothetical protein n=1 Tax=uncultured Veillonella sp. TaxID=159268 RepID=UPI0025943A02|nr:hypothetical protein [uncultured Veillonella sp.]